MTKKFWYLLLLVFLVLLLLAIPSSCTRASDESTALSPLQIELKKKLTPIQYKVTQEDGTEKPFGEAYKEVMAQGDGIYVDIVSGEPLFSSKEKYDSKTGWPSFFKPLRKENIVEKTDFKIGIPRTEVRSKKADSHLGHVFNDGPEPTGLRYCINAAALKFVPANKLEEEGYSEFLPLFNLAAKKSENNEESIVLAGGCFWGVQAVFKHVKGVKSALSGYSGGSALNPTYKMVTSGTSGHAEAVQVVFDTSQVSLEQLLQVFFEVAHNPTQLNRQGPDVGTQYRSAIFYKSQNQKSVVEKYIKDLESSKKYLDAIVTQVTPLEKFYQAEEYHQDYAEKNPNHPYIVIHDKPKVENLKKKFPTLWKD